MKCLVNLNSNTRPQDDADTGLKLSFEEETTEQFDSHSSMDETTMDPTPMDTGGLKRDRDPDPKTVSPELLAHPLPKSSLSYADAAASPVPPPLDPLSTPKPARKQLLPFLRVRINTNNTIQLRD
jgi:hypothetical protein